MIFNRAPLTYGSSIEEPDSQTIKMTPSLWNADLDDAARFGGELTRAALATCTLNGSYKYVTVDSKIHLLQKGMLPAIPGWHTDGVPRASDGNPSAGGPPQLDLQDTLDSLFRPTLYHLLVTGDHCPTQFFIEPNIEFNNLPKDQQLYAELTRRVEEEINEDYHKITFSPNSEWVNWDWWQIHRGNTSYEFRMALLNPGNRVRLPTTTKRYT